MKVAIITDQHFGARNDSVAFLDYFQKFYDDVFFPTLVANGISVVLVLGDTFDRRKYVNFYALQRAKEMFFDRLANACITVHMLAGNHDEGIQVVKFFLNISKEEQRQRLQSRLDDPHKQWKLQPSDFEDRKLWPDYMRAYQDALTHTDSDECPWYIIPADSKPHRDVLIGQVLVQTLEAMKLTPPKSTWDLSGIKLN